MQIRATRGYKDAQLQRVVMPGEVLNVSAKRAAVLIKYAVAERVIAGTASAGDDEMPMTELSRQRAIQRRKREALQPPEVVNLTPENSYETEDEAGTSELASAQEEDEEDV